MFALRLRLRRRYRLRCAVLLLAASVALGLWGWFVPAAEAAITATSAIAADAALAADLPVAAGASVDVSAASPVTEAAYIRFLASAEKFYKQVNEGKLREAAAELKRTETLFRSLPMDGIATAEGVDALAGILVELKRTAAAVSPAEGRWSEGAAKLRLAADALVHPANPLWHGYREVLRNDAAALEQAVKRLEAAGGEGGPATEPDRQAVREALATLSRRYELIRAPVLLSSSETFRVERADSVLRYAARLFGAAQADPARLARTLPAVREALEGLFPAGRDKAAFVPAIAGPPWVWPISVGAFIVTMLSWVGYRNYRAGR